MKENEIEGPYLVCMEKKEKIIFEESIKKNKITLVKYYSDGSVEKDEKIELLN